MLCLCVSVVVSGIARSAVTLPHLKWSITSVVAEESNNVKQDPDSEALTRVDKRV